MRESIPSVTILPLGNPRDIAKKLIPGVGNCLNNFVPWVTPGEKAKNQTKNARGQPNKSISYLGPKLPLARKFPGKRKYWALA